MQTQMYEEELSLAETIVQLLVNKIIKLTEKLVILDADNLRLKNLNGVYEMNQEVSGDA
jgi:hypothetical protein